MAGQLILRDRAADDRGSLLLAILLITVAIMLAGLLVPVVVSQANSTRFDSRRDHAINAAQAGVEAMIGQIRASRDSSGAGTLTGLPCTTAAAGGADTGTVDPAGTQSYRAYVYYFATNPHGHIDGSGSWLGDTSKQIQCTSGGTGVAPAYAVIVSIGTDTAQFPSGNAPSRTLEATYVVRRTNANDPGGLIHNYNGGDGTTCLDAGSSAPAAGTIVTLQTCQSGLPQQLWSFNDNLTISLSSTVDAATNNLGYCLDVPYSHYAGEPVKLMRCSTNTSTEQQWSYEGGYTKDYVATKSNSTQEAISGSNNQYGCLVPASPGTVGTNLVLGKCRETMTADFAKAVMGPESSVGAGDANAANGYLVNYGMFGTCMDMTEQDPNKGFMIAYTCRATPDPNQQPTGAQIWYTPTVPNGSTHSTAGQIHLRNDRNQGYCLTSPLTLDGYPSMTTCSSTSNVPTRQQWTIWRDTGSYATSYRIVDGAGRCLQPNDDTSTYYNNFPKLIVTTCSDTTLQKWNAPAGVTGQPITDYHEK